MNEPPLVVRVLLAVLIVAMVVGWFVYLNVRAQNCSGELVMRATRPGAVCVKAAP